MLGADHEHLARKMLNAYEAKDIEIIATMFSSDVVLRDWNHEVTGRSAAIKEFTKNFEKAEKLGISVLEVFNSETGVAVKVEITVNEAEILRVVDVISFNEDAEITSIISYKGL